jgi:RNA polymerase sigma-70 factor (ECF subfamily)
MVLGDSVASDLLQETNLHLWEQATQYDFDRPFLPWAFGFARQRVMAFRKSCSRSRLVFDDATLSLLGDKLISSASEADNRLTALRKCLKKLSPSQSELLRERYMAKTAVFPPSCTEFVKPSRGA